MVARRCETLVAGSRLRPVHHCQGRTARPDPRRRRGTINGWELVIIVVLAMLLIGPERLPEYAAKLRSFVRQTKQFADGARVQLREQLGPEFDDIDWKAYDPRQYDPRRIVREALSDLDNPQDGTATAAAAGATATAAAEGGAAAAAARPAQAAFNPDRPVPYDTDAT